MASGSSLFPLHEMRKGAEFSPCRRYRYKLWRVWAELQPNILFIGLNPSTADEATDDRTIARLVKWAFGWGYGGVYVGNLFAFRATKPTDMKRQTNPVGPDNDDALRDMEKRCTTTVLCWGTHGAYLNRERDVLTKVLAYPTTAMCFAVSKEGHPKHPLYLKGATALMPYEVGRCQK